MNPIEYLESKGFRITSDPTKYSSGVWGLRNYTVDGFNYDSFCYGYHRAYDMSKHDGAGIPAMGDGIVGNGTRDNGTFGGQVVIIYESLGVQVIYGHLKRPVPVKVGQKVKRGDIIGYQGNTNNLGEPMASHLHIQFQEIEALNERDFTCKGIDPRPININKKVEGGKDMVVARVGLDIGHGENTFPPGKGVIVGGKAYEEFHFNNKLGKRLKKLLEHNNFQVFMAQPFDSNEVGLVARTNYYDRMNLDLSISLHANAGNKNTGGRCAFYWYTSKQGKRFANLIIDNIKSKKYGIHGSGLHPSLYGSWTNLHMIRETTTHPLVLVEHGFMTNKLDFPLIFGNLQDRYIEDMAVAEAKAFCEYFGVSFKMDNVSAPPKESKPTKGKVLHRVQVGAYGVASNAKKAEQEVKSKGFETYLAYDNDEDLYRVQVGAFSEKKNAENLLKKMKSKGYKDAFIAKNDGHIVSEGEDDTKETNAPKEKRTPYLVGEWKKNKWGTQYIEAHGTITITASRVMSRFDSPFDIKANEGGWANRGWSAKYFEMVRVTWDYNRGIGYIMVAYRYNGRLKFVPYRSWNPITGEVGPEWATLT